MTTDSRPGPHRLVNELEVFRAAALAVAGELQSAYRALDCPPSGSPDVLGAMAGIGSAENVARGLAELLVDLAHEVDEGHFE